VNQYSRKYKKIPTSEAALNYMGMNIISAAMVAAGTTDDAVAIRAKVGVAAAALPRSKAIFSIKGVTPQGHVDADVLAAYVKDGNFTKLRLPATLLK
jgi:branched-chain amino acid transport system substrate-binding protein